MSDRKFLEARRQCDENDPPVEVGQLWIAEDNEQRNLRTIMILAQYPPEEYRELGRAWIYREEASLMNKHHIHELGVCPEFNLRYVFQLKE